MADYEIVPPSDSNSSKYEILPPGTNTAPSFKPPQKATTPLGNVWHGFQAPFVGLSVLASEAEQYIAPGETAKADLAEANKQRRAYEAANTGSWWELAGNMMNPLNYLWGGRGVIGAARGGAFASLVQPEHSPQDVAIGAATGGALGLVTEPIARAIAGKSGPEFDKFIRETYETGIKQSVAGKHTVSQLNQSYQRIKQGIDSIVANKPGLSYTGGSTGELPKTVEEFAQAIDQTKNAVFQKYDTMVRDADKRLGGTIRVSLTPAATELYRLANDPVTRTHAPGVASMAQHIADELWKVGSEMPSEAQKRLQFLNAKLSSFYTKKPSRETIGEGGIDAIVADKLREGIDAAVARAGQAGYQDFRNQYGALRKLEDDVVHRAVIFNRQEPGRGLLGRIGDAIGVHDVLMGIVHLDPTRLFVGGGLRAFTAEMRALRSPNRSVARIFKAAEAKSLPVDPARREVAAGIRQVVPAMGAIGVNNLLGQMAPL